MTTNNHNAQFVPPSGAIGKQPVQVGEVQGEIFAAFRPDGSLAGTAFTAESAGYWGGCKVVRYLAARQPAGSEEAHILPPLATERMLDVGWPYGEVIDASFDRQGAYADLVAAAPPAQGIDLGQVREIRIPARNNLDPISVFVQDQAAGRGRIVVTCYGNAWQAFWGAMGDRTVLEFVAQCDADYVAGNMISGRQTRMTKAERAYTERIATEVIAEFRTLRDSQRGAAPEVQS